MGTFFHSLWKKLVILAFILILITPIMAMAIVVPDTITPGGRPFGLIEVGVFIALITQIGAFFYWGGKIKTAIESHEKRITTLEDRGSMTAHEAALVATNTADDVKELQHRLEEHITLHMENRLSDSIGR